MFCPRFRFIQSPPADQPYTQLKAALLRLHTVSDRQRYHQLICEDCLVDRKPTGLLRKMKTLCGELHIEDKLFKMFLERLTMDVQTILASSSGDLSVTRLADMADRMLEVQQFQPPSIIQLSTYTLLMPNAPLVTQMTAEMVSLKLQLAHLTSRRSSSRSLSRHRSHLRPRTADTHCSSPEGRAREARYLRNQLMRNGYLKAFISRCLPVRHPEDPTRTNPYGMECDAMHQGRVRGDRLHCYVIRFRNYTPAQSDHAEQGHYKLGPINSQ
ncbi:unnamed protein product [Schistocephalus solidus]|uniref:Uncharacterized protein n=1 Tax=Schistocephalus solidus TaxID=70667 RepID=A0A183T8K7_SCHSO|nr:unnamed protein product [Schistocephalus solidus]